MHGQDPGEHTDHLTLRQNKHSSSCLSCWRSTMVASHEISIFLGLLAYTETNPATHIHIHIHKCVASLALFHLSFMNSLPWCYWYHSWPVEMQRMDNTMEARFGRVVWGEIKKFLDRGSVAEEIINNELE